MLAILDKYGFQRGFNSDRFSDFQNKQKKCIFYRLFRRSQKKKSNKKICVKKHLIIICYFTIEHILNTHWCRQSRPSFAFFNIWYCAYNKSSLVPKAVGIVSILMYICRVHIKYLSLLLAVKWIKRPCKTFSWHIYLDVLYYARVVVSQYSNDGIFRSF